MRELGSNEIGLRRRAGDVRTAAAPALALDQRDARAVLAGRLARGVSRGRFSFLRPGRGDALVQSAQELVAAVRLDAIADTKVAELSYGQQRQLEIALALAGAPRFILFDEPAAGLSPTERRELVAILTTLPRHIGYIIIEHDMDVALRVAESVSMMHNGRIFKEGAPEEIEGDPEVQALYLGGGAHG